MSPDKYIDIVTDKLVSQTKWEDAGGHWYLFDFPFGGSQTYELAWNNGFILRLSMVLSTHEILMEKMLRTMADIYGVPKSYVNESMLLYWDKLMMEVFGRVDSIRQERPKLRKESINESQNKLDRYHNYVVDDMIKNTDFSVTDAVSKIFVNIKLPFRPPKAIPMYFGGVLRWTYPNKSFGKYVIEKYGVDPMKHYGHDIYEWTIVWNLFVSKFLPIAREKVRELLAPYGYK